MIPPFDHNNVLPPHLGDVTNVSNISPYTCNTLELCQRFATSQERVDILKGYIAFRSELNRIGLINGFQWLNGSFTEDIELSENRPPGDLDLVTFYLGSDDWTDYFENNFQEFSDSVLSKLMYKLDHYPFDYNYNLEVTIQYTAYWFQLFTHNRKKVWKGILRVELDTPDIDIQALEYLNSLVI